MKTNGNPPPIKKMVHFSILFTFLIIFITGCASTSTPRKSQSESFRKKPVYQRYYKWKAEKDNRYKRWKAEKKKKEYTKKKHSMKYLTEHKHKKWRRKPRNNNRNRYRRRFKQVGIASWYGKSYHRRNTSSGEKFNMYGLTAAHRKLPFGTYVIVKNLRNGRSVKVRINDRGPFVKGRIINLSYKAAKQLDIVNQGVVKVEILVDGQSKYNPS